jgi:Rdx family.
MESYPGAEIEMIPSRGGRFEVTLDGALIFEKSKIGRHAKRGEIMEIIARTSGTATE